MWQDLYPKKYLEHTTLEDGEIVGSNDPLNPFHKDSDRHFWDSNDCRYQRQKLGYTYQELQIWLPEYKTDGVFDQLKY